MKIPISAIVVTKNEESNIASCLESLEEFDEVIVVDSRSEDSTVDIAISKGARVFPFYWNGKYPKKRQWIIDNIKTSYDLIFFVDADETVPPKLCKEIRKKIKYLNKKKYAGFFVKGKFVWKDKLLNYGMKNSKIALFNKKCFYYPQIDDLDIEEMGEMEGHYQPVLNPQCKHMKIGTLSGAVIHYACSDMKYWEEKLERYKVWKEKVSERKALPDDPVLLRKWLKRFLLHSKFTGKLVFFYSYFWCLGFLDGAEGREYALSRARYYSSDYK